ncbi:metallo-beta-lactamase superfamily hydrolase [Spiroplasma sabaudiense Ar-1343]|uniref:Metallo-beta-lactamase superfamily hydrolase n=1 Tax=Spiroplasma sabaudiense Ar-1343 TaxID=1276257 RepID=W6AAK0_9MOLU|nr:ribonuclease J [Spiroplasma sabaudiense]AHI54188.1 metallo-beta-lactamase superfamily hydrolase [Spiroplasma sabaudiense Ar-1343]
MTQINFMALGGQDERGKNLFIVEVNEELFIFDSGIKFPEKGILGIDIVIPNLEFLKNNKHRVKGVFISNPAAYNAGSINYILREVDAPVYCNELTTLVLKYKTQKLRLKNRENNFKIVKDKEILKIGSLQVEVFRTTSSFPESFGFAIQTDLGSIVYIGDYIMDGKEQSYFSTDLQHLNSISEKGVLALISDAECASRHSYTVPNHKIEAKIAGPMKEKARLIIGIFEEDIFKFSEIAREAIKNNRKMAIYGRSLATILESQLIKDKMNISEDNIFSINEFMESENGILLVTGTGDLLYSRLAKIATGNDTTIEFTEKDIIILATPPAPGVEMRHAQILDELARTNARLIVLSEKNIWAMHASYEDIKLMTRIMKPQYFIPVKALYKDFLEAEKAAIEAGVKPENVGLIDNGQILTITPSKKLIVSKETIKVGDIYVDGTGIGDIGAVVLNERKQLATDGVIIIGANLIEKDKELTSLIDIQMRGVIYINEDNPIFKSMQKNVVDILEKAQSEFKTNPNAFDLNNIKREIISKTKSLVKQDTGKQPIVLVIINEIDGSIFEPRKYSRPKVENN